MLSHAQKHPCGSCAKLAHTVNNCSGCGHVKTLPGITLTVAGMSITAAQATHVLLLAELCFVDFYSIFVGTHAPACKHDQGAKEKLNTIFLKLLVAQDLQDQEARAAEAHT